MFLTHYDLRFPQSQKMRIISFFLIVGLFLGFIYSTVMAQTVDSLVIKANTGDHLFHFSNKQGSFYVGETKGTTRHFLMGYISYREQLFSDYTISVNGKPLKRDDVSTRVSFRPYILKREYPGKVTESVFMPDNEDALAIRVHSANAQTVSLNLLGNNFDRIVAVDTADTPNTVAVSLNTQTTPSLTIATVGKIIDARMVDGGLLVETSTEKIASGHMEVDNSEELFAIGVGLSGDQSSEAAIATLTGYDSYIKKKKGRLDDLIAKAPLRVSDPNMNEALEWALCSFDALNMDETRTGMGKGIYAGYPWFQDYWGRDSFIAMRALTITGRFRLVKENLESFLKYQKLKDDGPAYGKIPNRVRPDEQIYNTADATPHFLIEAQRYVAYSADSTFAYDIFHNIEAAVLGTIKYRTDSLGFITHGPADSWMDAVGPRGPYSPRGNRANDIQALWIEALQSSLKLCKEAGGKQAQVLSEKVRTMLDKVKQSFASEYIDKPLSDADGRKPVIFDALHTDDHPSAELRPNGLFCLDNINQLKVRQTALLQIFNRLATPYGVMSLDPDDPHFHPYHQFEPVYEQDASYHNGIIWLWNTGELIEQMTKRFLQDQVYTITRNYSKLILNGVALGTLPELFDAFPRNSEYALSNPDSASFRGLSRFDQMNIRNTADLDRSTVPGASGTFSQAWSLSEYIRSFYESYAGIRYHPLTGFSLHPALPSEWHHLSVESQLGVLELKMTANTDASDGMHYSIDIVNKSNKPLGLPFQDKFMDQQLQLKTLPGLTHFDIKTNTGKVSILENGEPESPHYEPPVIMNAYKSGYAKKFHFRAIANIPVVGRTYYSQTH